MSRKKSSIVEAAPVAVDLGASLQARRQRSSSWESSQGAHKRRFSKVFGDQMDEAASQLAQDVSTVLAEQVDELSTYNHDFRVGMARVFIRVLRLAHSRKEQVALFNEAIPGFTLLLFKKDPSMWTLEGDGAQEAAAVEESPEVAAAGQVISQFVQRTGDRVLTVETDDALFVFFPASDIKKNLKEMGFYYTE